VVNVDRAASEESPEAREGISASGFEEARGAHAAADAHGHDAVAPAAAAELVEDRRGELRAGAPEGVAEGDGAAVDVELLVGDPELRWQYTACAAKASFISIRGRCRRS
jgi:hypothetical protein